MITYIFHTDPGHGWIAVPIAELVELGIAGQISSYSYQRGNMAYLEEDCDAPRWAAAYEKKHGQPPQLIDSYQENTPIRHYGRYHRPSAMLGSFVPANGITQD